MYFALVCHRAIESISSLHFVLFWLRLVAEDVRVWTLARACQQLEDEVYFKFQLDKKRAELLELQRCNENLRSDLKNRNMELDTERLENRVVEYYLQESQQLNKKLQTELKQQNMKIAQLEEKQKRLKKDLKAAKDAEFDMELMEKIIRLGCTQEFDQEEAPESATEGNCLKLSLRIVSVWISTKEPVENRLTSFKTTIFFNFSSLLTMLLRITHSN